MPDEKTSAPSPSAASEQTIVFGIVRKSLEATVIHACPKCGQPGVKNGQPVGAICPWCGGTRRRDLELGELSASMPKWLWNMVLAVKWCVVQTVKLSHRVKGKGIKTQEQ